MNTNTPETEAETMDGSFKEQGCTITLQQWDYYKSPDGDVVMADFARKLERERDEARAAISNHTVSCSNCNESARTIAEMREAIKEARDGLEDWQCLWRDVRGDVSSRASLDGFALEEVTSKTLDKLQPFLK